MPLRVDFIIDKDMESVLCSRKTVRLEFINNHNKWEFALLIIGITNRTHNRINQNKLKYESNNLG